MDYIQKKRGEPETRAFWIFLGLALLNICSVGLKGYSVLNSKYVTVNNSSFEVYSNNVGSNILCTKNR